MTRVDLKQNKDTHRFGNVVVMVTNADNAEGGSLRNDGGHVP